MIHYWSYNGAHCYGTDVVDVNFFVFGCLCIEDFFMRLYFKVEVWNSVVVSFDR